MILTYLFLLALAQTLVLPPEWPNIVKPTLFSLRETKQKLFTSLQSLMTANNPYQNLSIASLPANLDYHEPSVNDTNHNTTTTNLLFIPRELINPTMFQTLGLTNLVPSSNTTDPSSQKWMNLTSTDQLLIPDVFKTFFIFNTTKPSLVNPLFKNYQNQNHQISNLNKFLIRSIPFDMPSLLSLVDYYMVVPELPRALGDIRNITSNIYHKSVLSLLSEYLPIFRNQLSEKKPMIVFMFNETEPEMKASGGGGGAVGGTGSSPIISIKNYLSNTSISSFFDKFANIWLKQVNYESLVHAVYCNVNPTNQQGSYCLKIQNQMIHILPIFRRRLYVEPIVRGDDLPPYGEYEGSDILATSTTPANTNLNNNAVVYPDVDEVQSQAIRQIHDKLSTKKDKTKMTSQEFMHDPKTTIEKLDEKFDDALDYKITKLMQTKEAVRDTLDFKKTKLMNTVEHTLDGLDDKTDMVADSLKRKKTEMLTYKFSPRLFKKKEEFEKDGGGKFEDIGVDENYDSDCGGGGCSPSIYVNDGKEYINKRNQFYEPMMSWGSFPDQGFVLPLELISFEEDKYRLPRHKTYSQVVNLQTGRSLRRAKRLIQFIANEDDKNCQPITWYNIFHYSIFGEPKFCKDEYETKKE
ncbi:hypothetical protein Cantr_10182 [Candida viswanathii]|uniref:Uncharacterized protein n=1 Tax=Candida viswanathii TaxID=5486 RepID=A0A367YCG5_9ASCO|nr:hypothetical protein Cantr_10182 [Candida viswanathii]